MSQPATDHVSEPASPPAQARSSEHAKSELQRAVQMRALESMERQRAQAKSRPSPLRRIAMFVLALIPVVMLFTAVDGLLRVFHHINYLYNSPEADAASAPAASAEEITQSEPGVVLLQPLPSEPSNKSGPTQ